MKYVGLHLAFSPLPQFGIPCLGSGLVGSLLISPDTTKVILHRHAHRSTPSRQFLTEILSLGDSRVCQINN